MSAFPLPGFEEDGRHLRNGHTLALVECDWRCETCGHSFDAASDAGRFACGQDCTGKHPGQDERDFDTPTGRLLSALFPKPKSDGAR